MRAKWQAEEPGDIVSVHATRSGARRKERKVQRQLDGQLSGARGARVKKAGPLMWAVELTATRGH